MRDMSVMPYDIPNSLDTIIMFSLYFLVFKSSLFVFIFHKYWSNAVRLLEQGNYQTELKWYIKYLCSI